MACSTAIHLAALVVADRFFNDDALPSTIDAPLLVSIETPSTAADVAEPQPASPPPAKNNVRQEEVARAAVAPTETPEITASPEKPARVAETRPMPANAPAPETAAPRPFVAPIISPAVVMVKGAQAERSVPNTAALSPQQDKMLRQKLSNWADDLRELSRDTPRISWTHDGKEYLAEFTNLPIEDEMGFERIVVEISTQEDGKRLSSQVHMKRLAFSNFAQFVNRWDPTVEIHNDELDGRFHSNSAINLSYDRKARPLFHSKVTTSSRRIGVNGRRDKRRHDEIFLGGLETGVGRIPLPSHFAPLPDDMQTQAGSVHRFDQDTRVVFGADGSYAWQSLDRESSVQQGTLSDEQTTYFIAADDATVYVRGTVNGRVLVYAHERIVIEDDLVYAHHPEEHADVDDYLGLVSDKFVEIAHSKVTGPGDLLINAAIYAKRRFRVRGYRSRDKALLDLYGSLSAGTISASEPRYSTRIRFDRRFEKLRPPGFPMTDRYEVESWDASWNVEPAQ